METKNFTMRANNLYAQLRQLGDEARQIITDFVAEQGGSYTINIDEDDHVWVGEEIYVTALKTDTNGNVLVSTPGNTPSTSTTWTITTSST